MTPSAGADDRYPIITPALSDRRTRAFRSLFYTRLNRYGDRHLNEALDVIARVRMAYHDQTRQYVAKQTALGKSYREIKRLIKRYLARSTFRTLEHYAIPA
ncbi:hypothetical protein SAMN06298212_1569 [Ruaniaceae bacterium KH17]|nr:hypothetical protein SAMN06298212_1569 [Ruaniaceae bacterium KH17]